MTEHWNVQIRIQRVTKESRSGVMGQQHADREVTEVLSLAVTEATETQAHEKVMRLLKANAPWAGDA